jgi:hypothetical protein
MYLCVSRIPPSILYNDNLIFDDIERANLFNIYFSKQSEIDDSNSNIPNLLHVTNQINLFNYVPPDFPRRIHVCNFFD